MKKIMLVTGEAGDAQGWGNMHVTHAVQNAILAHGYDCNVLQTDTPDGLREGLDEYCPDIVWSSLYFFSSSSDIIGAFDNAIWVADLLDQWGVKYIGPSANVMKNLISKFTTHEILQAAGVAVPQHRLCPPSTADSIPFLPAFIKPNGESRSIGISEKSVAITREQLAEQIDFIHRELKQEALVEELLPGKEYTVMVVGNGERQEILPGRVTVSEEHYGRHRILRSDLRGVGLTKVSIPTEHFDDAVKLAGDACKALNCKDHIRIDMREDKDGNLRIMEVNGIPGLKPGKSWSPQIFNLYHPGDDSYTRLIGTIINQPFESECSK